jgi:hypothetical protein
VTDQQLNYFTMTTSLVRSGTRKCRNVFRLQLCSDAVESKRVAEVVALLGRVRCDLGHDDRLDLDHRDLLGAAPPVPGADLVRPRMSDPCGRQNCREFGGLSE